MDPHALRHLARTRKLLHATAQLLLKQAGLNKLGTWDRKLVTSSPLPSCFSSLIWKCSHHLKDSHHSIVKPELAGINWGVYENYPGFLNEATMCSGPGHACQGTPLVVAVLGRGSPPTLPGSWLGPRANPFSQCSAVLFLKQRRKTRHFGILLDTFHCHRDGLAEVQAQRLGGEENFLPTQEVGLSPESRVGMAQRLVEHQRSNGFTSHPTLVGEDRNFIDRLVARECWPGCCLGRLVWQLEREDGALVQMDFARERAMVEALGSASLVLGLGCLGCPSVSSWGSHWFQALWQPTSLPAELEHSN